MDRLIAGLTAQRTPRHSERCFPVQIGWLDVREHEYTNRGFECAAWSETMIVRACRVPLMYDGYYLLASAPAVVKRDYFPALYCGVAIGKPYDVDQNAGRATSRHWQSYAYTLRDWLSAKDTDAHPVLFPNWTLKRRSMWHGAWAKLKENGCAMIGASFSTYEPGRYEGKRCWHDEIVPVLALPAPV